MVCNVDSFVRQFITLNFTSSAAQQPNSPPVTQAGLAPVSPWSAFLTWDQPSGVLFKEIWGYKLNFSGIVEYVTATGPLMFFAMDYGITPGIWQYVDIVVVYKEKAPSSPITRSCIMPAACTYTFCLLFLKVLYFNEFMPFSTNYT